MPQLRLPAFSRLALPPRPAYLLLPALIAIVFIGFFAVQQAPAQSLPATPVVVITNDSPYTNTALTYGVSEALDSYDVFKKAEKVFIDNNTSFLLVDLEKNTISLYKDGKKIFVTSIEQTPTANSWLSVKSGLYRVTETQESVYDAVNRAYYQKSVKFGNNYIIHGTVATVDGEVVEAPERTGIRVSETAANDLLALIEDGWPVLVHTPAVAEADSFTYTINGPYVPARSYVVADVASGDILFQNKQTTPLPIASLTKLMTAVVAAEEYDMSSRIRITQEQYVNTLVPRLEGRSEANLFSLVQLLMVESSNEAAEVIAAHMGRDEFIKRMNAKAAELGMTSTTFTDPSGLDNTNVSSAADLLILTRYISEQHPFIWSVSMEEVEEFTPSEEFVNLDNFNEIKDIDNVVGGKIGETQAARQTSVSLHRHTIGGQERTIAIVILGTESRTNTVTAIDTFIERQYAAE